MPEVQDFSRVFRNLLQASPLQHGNTDQDSLTSVHSMDCQTRPIVYFLIVRDAHGSPDQRGLRTKGGRANRRRCAR